MGVFASQSDLFTEYRGRIQFRDKVLGGAPRNPKLIEGWLLKNTGLAAEGEELYQAVVRTMRENGVELTERPSWDELMRAAEKTAGDQSTCGFKRNDGGLYIEQRQLKAALKESTNILFAGQRWGVTKKGPKSFLAERVFINPDHLNLGVVEPDGVEFMTGQIDGPKGRRSVLGYYEYVTKASFEFTVRVVQDAIEHEWWADIWTHAEENGLGAVRSMGYGKYDVVSWERVEPTPTKKTRK